VVDKGKLEIIHLLLEHGAELDKFDCQGDTPLYLALGGQSYRIKGPPEPVIVKSLLKAGADPWKFKTRGGSNSQSRRRGRPVKSYLYPLYSLIRTAFRTCDKTISKLFLPYIKTIEDANQALN